MKNLNIKKCSMLIMLGGVLSFAQASDGQAKVNTKISVQDSVKLSALDVAGFEALMKSGALVLDTRSAVDFASGYIPGSIQVGWNGPFKIWIPKILTDKNQKIILVADSASVGEQFKVLSDLGYTAVLGYLNETMKSWANQNPLDTINEITAKQYYELSKQGQIIDVRAEKEFEKEHIDNAMNFPLTDLANFNLDLKKSKTYYIQCQSGYRSMIALSILKAKGVNHIVNIQGGYQALKKTKEDK